MMTPARWTDAQGRELPTRSCPRCQRVIPVNRWSAPAGGIRRRPSEVFSFVEWRGHQQEVTLVPEGPLVGYGIDGWGLPSVLSALGILLSIAFAFLLLPLALSPADRLRA
jgi:hypothetical protein